MTTKSRITAGKEIIIKKLEILSPEQFHSQIEERISELEQALKTKQHAVKHTPSGLIRIVRQKNRLQFYKRSSAKDAQGTYMPLSQEKLARNMVQNDYDQKTLPVIEAEIGFLKKILAEYKTKTSCCVYDNLPSTRQQVVTPLTLPDEQYADAWLKVEYRCKKLPDDTPPFYTDNNEHVRSKSEVIIANALKAAGVPYRYEFPLLMDKNAADPDFPDYDFCRLHPDFYCLNLRTRGEFAWEHFGMMDNPEYASRATEKLALYAENGFFPGKNLIITMETTKNQLSSKTLKEIIKTYLK
jgi:hypothetical protein